MIRIAVFVSLVLSHSDCCHGFVVDDVICPAPSPCLCHGTFIDCTVRGFSRIPTFRTVTWHSTKMSLGFQANRLTTLLDGEFSSLNVSSYPGFEIDLHLTSNHISSMSSHAFRGIEHVVTELYLEDNLLTNIPLAVGKLINLRKLQMPANPLSSFIPHTMTNLGRSLEFFYFTADKFTKWPMEIGLLSFLKILRVGSLLLEELPDDAFRGLETNLTQLDLFHADIKLIPSPVCRLLNLQVLTCSNSRSNAKDGNAVFLKCNPKLEKVTNLTLTHDLKAFPDIFSDFPKLNMLEIRYNPSLAYINESLIPTNTSLQEFKLTYAIFDRIPYAVQRFSYLQRLDLSHNKITSVQYHDLENMVHLTDVILASNPISFISPDAFETLPSLTHLDLSRTNIKTVPTAIENVQNLKSLNLSLCHVTCDSGLKFLQDRVRQHSLMITGNCGSLSMQSYIMSLPHC